MNIAQATNYLLYKLLIMNCQLSESVSRARHLDSILNTKEDTMLLNVGLAEAISEDFNFNVRVLWFVLYGW